MESTVGGKDAAIEPPRMGLWRVDEKEGPCLFLKWTALARCPLFRQQGLHARQRQ